MLIIFFLFCQFPSIFNSVDPMTRKDWYDIKVPALFANRIAGTTPVNRTHGQSALTFF